MSWKQVSIHCTAGAVEQVENVLLDSGAVSVTLSDAAAHDLLEPRPGETPIWPNVIVTGLFDSSVDPVGIEQALREAGALQLEGPVVVSELEDREWSRSWMDRFRPMRYGERLWVCPSWEEPPDPAAVNLVLDPGLAFGTGTHATTALCLQWLEAHPPLDQEVIDFGCGSGILGIAAIKLGARRCLAVDIDPQARQATAENAERNDIDSQRLSVHEAEGFTHPPVDLVMANILAGPLIELAPSLSALVKPGGWIVLSGILADQVEAVAAAFEGSFDLEAPRLSEAWALVAGQRRATSP